MLALRLLQCRSESSKHCNSEHRTSTMARANPTRPKVSALLTPSILSFDFFFLLWSEVIFDVEPLAYLLGRFPCAAIEAGWARDACAAAAARRRDTEGARL